MNSRALQSLLTLFFVVASAFLAADMVNTLGRGALTASFTTPKTVKRPIASELSPGAQGQPAFPIAEAGTPTLTLVGTTTGAYPYAVIVVQGREQELYRLRDDVGGGWLIDEIGVNRVVVKNGPRREVVEVTSISAEPPKPEAAGASAASRAGIRLDPREVDAALSDLNKVLTQARVVPNMIAGKISGYTIFEIVPGSIYSRLGLRNNDVVERINGVEIKSPDTLYQLFQQIRNERRVALDLSRGGKRESVNIEIR